MKSIKLNQKANFISQQLTSGVYNLGAPYLNKKIDDLKV